MIDKKQLIEELLECVKDATDTETQITGLSMCATLMNEVLDEALTIHSVVVPKGMLCFCGQPELPQYSPCCSLKCWHDQFD